jgi:SAM-dependent methyltransferase
MCLHWANDPVGQLVQARHALKPDGLLLCTFFGGQTLHELRASLAEAEAAVTGGLSPRIAPMGEIRDLGALLQRAGFALPVADSTPLTVSYANAFHLMHDLRKMGENNALAQRIKHATRRNILTEAASIYAGNFRNDDDRVDATFEIITLTGWAPAENQQQPLRPGSATTRLADALGAKETPLNKSND